MRHIYGIPVIIEQIQYINAETGEYTIGTYAARLKNHPSFRYRVEGSSPDNAVKRLREAYTANLKQHGQKPLISWK